MRLLLCALWLGPGLAYPGALSSDVERAFTRAAVLARRPRTRLFVLERGDPRDCAAGAYSEQAFVGARPYDAVFVCSSLGLVAKDYDQVFFVLAHEFGHLALRHGQAAPGAGQEFEADRYAVELARRAGLDPAQGAVTQRRVADYLAAAGKADAPGHDRLERARRIRIRAR
jgi:Zn-dependent protease with chaperone function